MSSIGPEDEFVSEDELKGLLERWVAPEPSTILDKRVVNSYHREFGGVSAAAKSVPLPQRQKEVSAMKVCSTCQEEFADKFSFCPVDGTPLNGFSRRDESVTRPAAERSVPVVEKSIERSVVPEIVEGSVVPRIVERPRPQVSSSPAHENKGEYHLTIMEDAGLAYRLVDEVKEVTHQYELTWPEFKRDPIAFTKRSIAAHGEVARRAFGNRNVMIALGTAVLAMGAL